MAEDNPQRQKNLALLFVLLGLALLMFCLTIFKFSQLAAPGQ